MLLNLFVLPIVVVDGKNIEKEDDTIIGNEWYQWLCQINIMQQAVDDELKKVNDDIERRSLRFIRREHNFREEIEEMQGKLRIRLGDEDFGLYPGKKTEEQKQNEVERKQDMLKRKYEDENEKIVELISNLLPTTIDMQRQQRADIARKFNSSMNKLKKDFEEQMSFKGDQEGDLKERENEMQHNLELITSIAQRIDNENRLYIKKNAQLKKEYKEQEADREDLVRKLVMQKSENKNLKDEIAEFKRIIAEKQADEEQVDVNDYGMTGGDGDTAASLKPPRANNTTLPELNLP